MDYLSSSYKEIFLILKLMDEIKYIIFDNQLIIAYI